MRWYYMCSLFLFFYVYTCKYENQVQPPYLSRCTICVHVIVFVELLLRRSKKKPTTIISAPFKCVYSTLLQILFLFLTKWSEF